MRRQQLELLVGQAADPVFSQRDDGVGRDAEIGDGGQRARRDRIGDAGLGEDVDQAGISTRDCSLSPEREATCARAPRSPGLPTTGASTTKSASSSRAMPLDLLAANLALHQKAAGGVRR